MLTAGQKMYNLFQVQQIQSTWLAFVIPSLGIISQIGFDLGEMFECEITSKVLFPPWNYFKKRNNFSPKKLLIS